MAEGTAALEVTFAMKIIMGFYHFANVIFLLLAVAYNELRW